ncbi:hypothetical protein SPIRO4BDMA_50871 [uncultured spirochete]|jgi:hypothetical protein|uniref:Uncharacterized protein n=1 Tax=uncultured spirochete TaxID=156406 RepID=A0A3P3XST5_9SPIR|nr:hypothetical protein SPIRO4BDMA_50871 [uncultured spirochete]
MLDSRDTMKGMEEDKTMSKKSILVMVFLCSLLLGAGAQVIVFGMGDPDIDAGLNELNASAKLNMPGFQAEVALAWGQPAASITVALSQGLSPGEVYLAAALAHFSGKPLNVVIELYKKDKAKGWGALAKELGIKPGSKEFKLLKETLEGSRKKVKGKK